MYSIASGTSFSKRNTKNNYSPERGSDAEDVPSTGKGIYERGEPISGTVVSSMDEHITFGFRVFHLLG